MAMVEVVVARLGIDSTSGAYVVILQEKDGERLLPIWIAQPEAESIVLQMKHVHRERPMTHDLCRSLIQGLGATLRRVQITKVEKNTYYAELHLLREDRLIQIDARPSDSIAIALRFGAPVFADESLLVDPDEEESESDDDDAPVEAPDIDISPAERTGDPDAMSPEQLKEYLERLRPEDFGKFRP